MDAIGERLREERLRNGWSQKDLARESKTNVDTISGIETGQHEPRPSTLRKLARALDIEVRDLFEEPVLPGKDEAPSKAGTTVTPSAGDEAREEVLSPTLKHDYEGTLRRRDDAEELANRASEIEAEEEQEEPIFSIYYADEVPWDKAWELAREEIKEAREVAYEGKVTVRDDGERVKVFVQQGATNRIRDAQERAGRHYLKRADALDRRRGRV